MGQKAILRKLNKYLKEVKKYRTEMRDLTDEQLQSLTGRFKSELAEGKSLEQLLPEAYAAICEADCRVLGMFPYDVQILGGIGLHFGYMCEMNTGEGKTLSATMPLYLNALTGKGVILVTTNDYLARRDCEEMGPVYRFMGVSVADGVTLNEDGKSQKDNDEKKEIYAADIVYTTNGSLGFDYLFDNLVKDAESRFMRNFYYVIVDEVDAVLLDSATMPLVVAGSPRVQSNLYSMADFFVNTLEEGVDFETEEGAVWLTDKGVAAAESFYGISNFYLEEYFEINRHVTLALRAHKAMKKGENYVVTDENEVVLLDKETGRKLNGVKLRGGMNQAIEVKEGLKPSQETRSVASVTYQNLFNFFDKIGGMSGTISNTREELRFTYGVDTVVIPPNKPVIRKDYKDRVYKTKEKQLNAVVRDIANAHALGQPVLVVAAAIADTTAISEKLMERNIPHNVLNANNAQWEASIIKEAGQLGAVTVSTSMAGRGTDIKLGKGVKALGGLLVIGVGRMVNKRLERQARGRAGRQGDPGMSRFYISLEDDIIYDKDDKKLAKYISGKKRISKRKTRKLINEAQLINEEQDISSRESSTAYDEVMKKQRTLIYEIRGRLLDGGDISEEQFFAIAGKVIDEYVSSEEKITKSMLNRFILDNVSYTLEEVDESALKKKKLLKAYLLERIDFYYKQKKSNFENEKQFNDFIREIILTTIDNEWIEEVDYIQQLRAAVSGRSSAQRNPVFEYQNDAYEAYTKMEKKIFSNMLRNILLSSCVVGRDGKQTIIYP